ncbi:MAG: polysaccharide ABC transporter ATP-binding protein [Sulfuriferula sp.]|nr:polysaccharide ABC transporter ATP-binding protein [Sulfuriferula sp.]
MQPAISVKNLGKRYTLSHQSQERYTAIRDVVTNGVKQFARKLQHPFAKHSYDPAHEEFWALRDVNFDIQQGDRIGIIGRNGAGKSTLLKILSRITEPTCGQIKIKGRISSLLEVGTGFHPELTGRENIFLNGAILGMSKAVITRKFDEIVAFAEVEKFLDTPVKRYSSGMYVRLAFAVAANLEPEILIIDEVLAVGDAQFQKKCLGKMEEVGKEGRTVIFVSHSMPTVTSLCDRAILLESGTVAKIGPTSEVVMHYYTNGLSSPAMIKYQERHPGDSFARLLSASIKTGSIVEGGAIEVSISEQVMVEMCFEILQDTAIQFVPNFNCFTADGVCAFYCHDTNKHQLGKGVYISRCYIPADFLNATTYFIGLAVSSYQPTVKVHFYDENCLSFNVYDPCEGVATRPETMIPIPGAVRPNLKWEINKL